MGSQRMNKNVTLNREQIEKLYEIANHFKEINHFNIKTDSSSGIGVGIVVTFDLFQKNDTSIDITDVKEW
jgi:Holliday junction resolvase